MSSTINRGSRLNSGQSLDGATEYLMSTSGQSVLAADDDYGSSIGLYVLSQSGGLDYIARTGVKDGATAVNKLNMQTDGNLVLYTNGKATFNSRTQGNPGAYVVMQNDGNVVVYSSANKPLWASGTLNRYGFAANSGGQVYDGYLEKGWQLYSPNRQYRLDMQSDGNLVLYATSSKRAIWYTRTQGNPDAYLKFQSDGNLVVYSAANKALWASHSVRKGGYYEMDVQNDGNLVQYYWATENTPRPSVLWSSHTAGKK